MRLPGSLGGDAITTSGLNYDANGNHRFLRNNQGKNEWLRVQDRLNDTLDALAAQGNHPDYRVQVSVVGMGDSKEANFPAIYADLFGERTFDNSNGGWGYEYFTSYELPDFVG